MEGAQLGQDCRVISNLLADGSSTSTARAVVDRSKNRFKNPFAASLEDKASKNSSGVETPSKDNAGHSIAAVFCCAHMVGAIVSKLAPQYSRSSFRIPRSQFYCA